MKVVIIGTGNVATVLGKKIAAAGHEIIQVIGRSLEPTNRLASILQCNGVYNTRYIKLYADIYIIAVSDKAIPAVAAQLKLHDKIVVHTAAAVSKDVLSACSANYGVLYPLQTLVKETPEIPETPLLIDANNEAAKKTLVMFSADWAGPVQLCDDEERLKLHVAAVFVNNFTNYLFTMAEAYCKKEQLKFSLLYPLMQETVNRLQLSSPADVQTGPAAREDISTIEKHEYILQNHPELINVYHLFTEKILSGSKPAGNHQPATV